MKMSSPFFRAAMICSVLISITGSLSAQEWIVDLPATEKERWVTKLILGKNEVFVASRIGLDEKTVTYLTEVFDRKSGQLVHSSSSSKANFPFTLVGDSLFINGVFRELRSDKVLGSISPETKIANWLPAHGNIYIVQEDGKIACFNKDRKLLWQVTFSKEQKPSFSEITATSNGLFFEHSQGAALISSASGKYIWNFIVPEVIKNATKTSRNVFVPLEFVVHKTPTKEVFTMTAEDHTRNTTTVYQLAGGRIKRSLAFAGFLQRFHKSHYFKFNATTFEKDGKAFSFFELRDGVPGSSKELVVFDLASFKEVRRFSEPYYLVRHGSRYVETKSVVVGGSPRSQRVFDAITSKEIEASEGGGSFAFAGDALVDLNYKTRKVIVHGPKGASTPVDFPEPGLTIKSNASICDRFFAVSQDPSITDTPEKGAYIGLLDTTNGRFLEIKRLAPGITAEIGQFDGDTRYGAATLIEGKKAGETRKQFLTFKKFD